MEAHLRAEYEHFIGNLVPLPEIGLHYVEKSRRSPFKPTIIFLSPANLRPHELTSEEDTQRVRDSFRQQQGWFGPPIAVAGIYGDELWQMIEPGVYMYNHGAANNTDFGILDGHNRTKVSLENRIIVPVQIFPLRHKKVVIDTWPQSGLARPYTPDEVREFFQKRQHVVPKGTKFQILGGEGRDRIMMYQPQIHIPLHQLQVA